MATLREYFKKDFIKYPLHISSGYSFLMTHLGNEKVYKVDSRIHFHLDTNSYFLTFFISDVPDSVELFKALLLDVDRILKELLDNRMEFGGQSPDEIPRRHRVADMNFSKSIFFYYDGIINVSEFLALQKDVKNLYTIHARDTLYANAQSKSDVPLAFICHDSRDKEKIALPLADALLLRDLPIWYDEYSLNLGDNLRESIEKGLRSCKHCILVLSDNFLNNNGWTKVEFNSIFTREIIETKNLILPVWAGVTPSEIYNYSPVLLNKVGIKWELGLDAVLDKILPVLYDHVISNNSN